MKAELFKVVGDEPLSYWFNGDGYWGFQTTDPDIARAFGKRKQAKFLTWSVNKRVIRVFEEKLSGAEAAKLVKNLLKIARPVQNAAK